MPSHRGWPHAGSGALLTSRPALRDQPDLTVYSVSKGAIDKYTQDLAAQMQGTNVLVSHVDPGWLRTDLGGPNAEHPVESVLPGALVPALLADFGPNGQFLRRRIIAINLGDWRGQNLMAQLADLNSPASRPGKRQWVNGPT